MQSLLFSLTRPVLHCIDPEGVHALAIRSLKALPYRAPSADDPRLAVKAFGLEFPNPVGLAAGFDKQAEVIDPLFGWGFGFVEVGGVVPKPQPGNPKPRLFRLREEQAVINRFGFNSEGLDAMVARLKARAGRPGVVAVNIGANKESIDRVGDFAVSTEALVGLVDFLTVNVSSPNTPGLRDLQGEAFLDELLARIVDVRNETLARKAGGTEGRNTAVLLKISPDIDLANLDAIVATARRRKIDGLVVANTTIARPDALRGAAKAETGGLSGPPLFIPSTRLLAETYLRIGREMPLIGVGGVDSVETAWAKIRAGATLVELYTALVYKGPALVREIKQGLLERLGSTPLAAVVGRDAQAIADGDFGSSV